MLEWCKIVEVDGKQVLFTVENDCLAAVTVRASDFVANSEEGVVRVELKIQRREFEFKFFATLENARSIVYNNIIPALNYKMEGLKNDKGQ